MRTHNEWRGVLVGSLLVPLLSLGGCRQQVFEPVRDGLVETATVDGTVSVTTKADLLFVIDDSASMGNEQQKLAQGFPALIHTLDALDPPIDYRVAVLTTSVDERFGPCDPGDQGAAAQCSADFGGAGFTCEPDRACVRRFPDKAGKLVAAQGNPLVLERSKFSDVEFAQKFSQNVQVGLDGSRHEQPLRALSMAFADGTLDQFWRPDARLVVLVASDEDDCSDSTDHILALEERGGKLLDHCAEESINDTGKLDNVDKWVHSFLSMKKPGGGTREVALGAIVGLGTGTREPGMCVDDACSASCQAPAGKANCAQQCQGSLQEQRCIDECVAECVSFCGSQAPGRRLARVTRELNGPLASICESDFGPVLAKLARVIGIPEEIELPSTPRDARTFFFRVVRNGHTIECQEGKDYTIDTTVSPPVMKIDQGGACRLLPGDQWSVRYIAE